MKQYDISSIAFLFYRGSVILVSREPAPSNCIFIQLNPGTRGWQSFGDLSLRLYCPSLVAWIHIGRFLGEKFLVFWSLGANKIKNYHTYHTFYHTSRIFMAGFQWNRFSSQRKDIFHLNFSELRRIISTGREKQKHPATPVQSFVDGPPPFSRITNTTNYPRDPSLHVLTPRPPSTAYVGISWPRIEDTDPILSLYVAIRAPWRTFETLRNCVIYVFRVFFKILHYSNQNRSLPQTLFPASSAIIKDFCPWAILLDLAHQVPIATPYVYISSKYSTYLTNLCEAGSVSPLAFVDRI